MTNEDKVREAFGAKVKKSSSDPNSRALLDAFSKKDIFEVPGSGRPATKQDEQDLLEAFGAGPALDIYESFNPLILEEAALELNSINGAEEYKIVGTLVDSTEKTLGKGRQYPQSTLEKIVGKKLWRNGQIFLSHTARNLKDIKKLCGKVAKMWLDNSKLKFEATLQAKKIKEVPGLEDALEHKQIGVSMAVLGPRMDGMIVKDVDHVSLDLLADLSHPAVGASGIENVQTV